MNKFNFKTIENVKKDSDSNLTKFLSDSILTEKQSNAIKGGGCFPFWSCSTEGTGCVIRGNCPQNGLCWYIIAGN